MTLDQLIASMEKLQSELPSLIVKNTEVAALDSLALVDVRITEKGLSSTGAPFEDYTVGYKKRKQKAGRYRGKVDFTLTGQMLASTTTGFERIQPTERSFSQGRARIAFDGRDELTRKKLAGNNATRPGFLFPSKEEIDIVTKAANDRLSEDVAKFFEA